MAVVSIAQSITASSASASTLTATLPAAPTNGNYVVAVIAAGAAVASVTTGFTVLEPGSPSNPVLSAYKNVAAGGAPQSVTFTLGSAAPISIYYFELTNAASLVTSSTGTSTTAPSFSATLPTTWLPTVGDLPLAFFTSQPAATPTNQGGWTGLCALNAATGNVLDGQSGPTATSPGQSYTGMVTWSATNPAGEVILISANQTFYSLTSQTVLETLSSDTANARTSQISSEAIASDTSTARGSQEVLEAIGADTASGRTSQIYLELIIPLYERTSQIVLETLGSDTANARSSQMLLEVLFSSQGQRRRTVDEEWTSI